MINHKQRRSHRLSGFTLVELSVVIGVLGILATVGAMSYVKVQQQSHDAQRQNDIAALQSQLEKFYDGNGVYPPGCPQSSCGTWFLTENTSSPMISAATTPAALRSVFATLSSTYGDPTAPKGSNPITDISTSDKKYFYYGGTLNNRTNSSVTSIGPTTVFPCRLQSYLNPGEAGSYVAGYYSELTKSWVLQGGNRGVPFTVTAGSCTIGS